MFFIWSRILAAWKVLCGKPVITNCHFVSTFSPPELGGLDGLTVINCRFDGGVE